MAYIRVDVSHQVKNGTNVSFKAPCNCNAVSGLKAYFPNDKGVTTSQVFLFTDAHGNNLTGIANLFASGAIVKVILNVDESKAYIQNADTNKYLETALAGKAPASHNHQDQSLNPSTVEFSGNGIKLTDSSGELSVQLPGDSALYPLLHMKNTVQKTGLSNRNLIHNWYLLDPVNSRGQTEYVGSGYHVDRWRGGSTSDVHTLTETGLKVENKRTSGLSYMRQYLDDYLEPGTYTLSALVTAVDDTVIYMSSAGGAAVPRTLPLSVGLNTITAEIAANTVNRVQFTVGGSVTLAAVKLERGSVQTLAEQDAAGNWVLKDSPPDKGVEALRCFASTADSADTYANKAPGGTQLAYGSYEGTGTYGVDAPNTVTLPFAADMFIMLTRTYLNTGNRPMVEALWGTGSLTGTGANYICALPLSVVGTEYPDGYTASTKMPKMFGFDGDTGDYSIAKKSADGKTITWCHEGSSSGQFNTSGSTYHWMAIKF